MRAFKRNRRKLRLLFVATLCTTVIPFRSLAHDKETSNPPPKSVLAKPDSPAPLTERERWMLDRMSSSKSASPNSNPRAIRPLHRRRKFPRRSPLRQTCPRHLCPLALHQQHLPQWPAQMLFRQTRLLHSVPRKLLKRASPVLPRLRKQNPLPSPTSRG